MAKMATNQPSTVAKISLAKALAMLGRHHPPHIAGEILWREMAAGNVPYWPNDPTLATFVRKMVGKSAPDDPRIEHLRIEHTLDHEGSWVEFWIGAVRCTIYPIQVDRDAVLRLLPARAQAEERPQGIARDVWFLNELKRLKGEGRIANNTHKTEVAAILGPRWNALVEANPALRLKRLAVSSIPNYLRDTPGLWPLSSIE
jgi:hypothetical protein